MYKNYADIWADVPGFNHYEANRVGVIRRKNTGVTLRPFKRKANSLYVRLYTTPGEARERSVASVIWAAFYKRWPDRGMYVCHADGDLENLFLGNRSDVRKTQRRRDDRIWARLQEEGELVL